MSTHLIVANYDKTGFKTSCCDEVVTTLPLESKFTVVPARVTCPDLGLKLTTSDKFVGNYLEENMNKHAKVLQGRVDLSNSFYARRLKLDIERHILEVEERLEAQKNNKTGDRDREVIQYLEGKIDAFKLVRDGIL